MLCAEMRHVQIFLGCIGRTFMWLSWNRQEFLARFEEIYVIYAQKVQRAESKLQDQISHAVGLLGKNNHVSAWHLTGSER